MRPGPVEIRALEPALRTMYEARVAGAVLAERTRPLPTPGPSRRRLCGHDEAEVGPSCSTLDEAGVEICALAGRGGR